MKSPRARFNLNNSLLLCIIRLHAWFPICVIIDSLFSQKKENLCRCSNFLVFSSFSSSHSLSLSLTNKNKIERKRLENYWSMENRKFIYTKKVIRKVFKVFREFNPITRSDIIFLTVRVKKIFHSIESRH